MRFPLVSRRRHERETDELVDHVVFLDGQVASAYRVVDATYSSLAEAQRRAAAYKRDADEAREEIKQLRIALAGARGGKAGASQRAARAEHRATVLEDAIREHRDTTGRGLGLTADLHLHTHLPDHHQETT